MSDTTRVYPALDLETHILENTLTPGVWCPNCALPSAGTITIVTVRHSTLTVLDRTLLTTCPDCDTTRHQTIDLT